MANLKELRNRIGSVRNTRKITQAMSRIAAARLRKAQNAMLDARPYGERMAAVVGELLSELDDPAHAHPLLARREVARVMIVVVTADRGLCGGFNTNVAREAVRWIGAAKAQGRAVQPLCVGRKGGVFLEYRRVEVFARDPAPSVDGVLHAAEGLTRRLIGAFLDPDPTTRVDEVHVVYNYFRNVLTQEVTLEQLLPVPARPPEKAAGRAQRLYEPDAAQFLDHLLPVSVQSAVQQVLLNSVAAEIAARRQAMDSATDNASELIADLTLEYNRERQAAITKELMEIIGGAEALRG